MVKVTNTYFLYSIVLLLPIFTKWHLDKPPIAPVTPPVVVSGPEDCTETIVLTRPFDFVPVLKCQFVQPGILTYVLPLFADIDGDQETEVVVTLDYAPNGIIVINPHTCEQEYSFNVPGEIKLKDGGPRIG